MNPGTWAAPARKSGVLLVAAEADEIVPLHTVEDLQDRYGGAELIVIQNRCVGGLPQFASYFGCARCGVEHLGLSIRRFPCLHQKVNPSYRRETKAFWPDWVSGFIRLAGLSVAYGGALINFD